MTVRNTRNARRGTRDTLPLYIAAIKAKTAHRLGCQLMYIVAQDYYPAQFAVFYAARFSSAPSDLYSECLLYALRHLYHTRHIGLPLSGHGDAELVPSGCLHTKKQSALNSGMFADADHAQPGPSTCGYTVDLGSTTIHAVSGQHHATTLGTSPVGFRVVRGVSSSGGEFFHDGVWLSPEAPD